MRNLPTMPKIHLVFMFLEQSWASDHNTEVIEWTALRMMEAIEEEQINKCTIAITVAVAVISLRLSYCCLLAVWFGTTIYSIVSSSSSLLSSLLLSLIVIRLCEATSYCVIRNKCILSVAMLLSSLYLRPCLYLLSCCRYRCLFCVAVHIAAILCW